MKEGENFYKLGKKEEMREIVVFAIVKDGSIVVEKRKETSIYKGQTIIPGGKMEEGETVEEATRREMKEEVGIEKAEVNWVGSFRFTNEFGYLMHLCLVKTDEEIQCLDGDFSWTKFDDLLEISDWDSVRTFVEVVRNNLVDSLNKQGETLH